MNQAIPHLVKLRVASLALACEDIARLEDACATPGVGAMEADLAAALELLEGDEIKGEGRREVEERLRRLLRLVQLESYVWRSWDRAVAPGLLAQRVHYRASVLGLAEVAARAAARLEALGTPWLVLRWRAGTAEGRSPPTWAIRLGRQLHYTLLRPAGG